VRRRNKRQHRGRTKGFVKTFLRWVFPQHETRPVSRDLVVENASKQKMIASLYSSGLAIVSAGGLVIVVLNLLYRVGGNTNLALAIILALPVSALAVIVLLSLANIILIGTGNAFATLYGQREASPKVRRMAGAGLYLTILISLIALPWFFFVVLLLSTYIYWRSEHTSQPRTISVLDWVQSSSVPEDIELRRLWSEGRWALHRRGLPLSNSPRVPTTLPDPFRNRKIAAICADILERLEQIRQSKPQTSIRKVLSVFGVSLSIYASQLFTTPMNFAPLESVKFSSGAQEEGYVLATASGFLFVDSQLDGGRYLVSSDIQSREICEPLRWNRPLLRIISHQATGTGVDCYK